jgi:hypothetical protein
MSEYNFEEERSAGDFDFEPNDRWEETYGYEVPTDQINDWNIHNDHQDGNEDIDDYLDAIDPDFCTSCGADISRRGHYRMCDL